MSTNGTPDNKDSGTTDATTRLLADHVYLGRDCEGYHHHLDRAADTVTRFDDAGRIERRTDLGDRPLDHYLLFVADEIGWDDRRQLATWDVWPEVW
jgi:hypothetical protein